MRNRDLPEKQGLYDPRFEHDSCGVGFVVDMTGRKSNAILQQALTAVCCLNHRGAAGAEPDTGDGAGVTIQLPDAFFRAVVPFDLPPLGQYATGIAFLPTEDSDRVVRAVEKVLLDEGFSVLGWRDVPVDAGVPGKSAREVMPVFRQIFVSKADDTGVSLAGDELERHVYLARKHIEHAVPAMLDGATAYFPSLSARVVCYKGMLTPDQLQSFYADLRDERVETALALVHSRFSTTTFPSWPLAHPYRMLAHNGEINTVQGNENWMRAREGVMHSETLPDLERAFPICTPGSSDTARFDEALELLNVAGRPLHHAILMMIPEAWENHESMDAERKAFYRYHSALMEPWDGPASIAFTDGTVIGAVLDRNGLRPSRYWVTDDDRVIMASEVGVLDIPPEKIVRKGRLEPGRTFLVDTEQGRIIPDDEIKAELASLHPYQEWLDDGLVYLDDLPPQFPLVPQHSSAVQQQRMFGYTQEDLRLIIAPMARNAVESLGSMGTDTPVPVISDRPRMLYEYFKQLFAQVTNPPLDANFEALVTSLNSAIGPEGNLLEPGPDSCRQIVCPSPILTNEELAKLRFIDDGEGAVPGFTPFTVYCNYPVAEGGDGLRMAIDNVRTQVSEAIAGGANLIILSDRYADAESAPIPALLVTAAVHHHLVREKTRTRVGLVIETGEAREVHHFALLLGYGAGAINPYLAFDTMRDLCREGLIAGLTERKAVKNYIKAAGKGILKVMSKMGISTVASYTGAQIFEAVGLQQSLVDEYFTGTASRIEGIDLEVIAGEVAARHGIAYPDRPEELAHRELPVGGEYQWRREGEYHLFNPDTVYKLQHSTRSGRYDVFKEYTRLVDDQSKRLATLRGLFEMNTNGRSPVPIDEVEPVSEIVKRFSTGAMSYGSISKEAHENLAIAMNRIGGRSNTGEGGEDADRYVPMANGDSKRSAIKQVASGRFGVNSEYLVSADDLQIKMAQGAKPGEGGELPGHKVYPWIAKTRHSTPGVGLISPPPHHDIYSIEDIKQLIHDLKNANNKARVHVKLVAEVGVGTVAAGVSKAHADVVLISGHDGGTGAARLTSIKHAGAPWELGLAETQQTLVLNGLRDRIVVQVDGQLKTGRDVVIAALLGAEEFGFATAPLVVSGCIMMRVCHLDTCPVGVATQNPELRKKFSGKPEFVVNFMEFIAEEVREHLAALGFRSIEEAIGHVEVLDFRRALDHWKARGLDLSPILQAPVNKYDQTFFCSRGQDHGLERALDNQLIADARGALEGGPPVKLTYDIRNVNRTVGTMLGAELTRRWGGEGRPEGTIDVTFHGSAGQSFGAFVPTGITLRLEGDANDYFGKGLSGGTLVVRPPRTSQFVAEHNVIAGNVILYGATAGNVFIRGIVGERFCVRNSGAIAVVEGVGDHACEYMTGGRAVILGPTGRNFAAGMSGGFAYVWDPDHTLFLRMNRDMVDIDQLDDEDVDWLRGIITQHLEATGSEVAERVLSRWWSTVGSFSKVFPKDYKRVLEAERDALERGVDAEEAIMAAARG
ncbi:MAG TPA: glutamate synthase large subunit [Acidimicrobiia bacterium]|nr:glutamate synthase large subunit [Acidimicrobiia bacterium]